MASSRTAEMGDDCIECEVQRAGGGSSNTFNPALEATTGPVKPMLYLSLP